MFELPNQGEFQNPVEAWGSSAQQITKGLTTNPCEWTGKLKTLEIYSVASLTF